MNDSKELIVYEDDDGKKITCYCDRIEIKNGYAEFETAKNIMIIPLQHVHKIKKGKEEEYQN